MRRLLFLAILFGGLWVVDTLAFGGQYSNAVWSGIAYQGQEIRSGIDDFLGRALNR
jgi:hypothetical protein